MHVQVLALARVLVKKEDPFSRQRFSDVISTGRHAALFGNGVFHVFWQRLSARIADVFADKLKAHPVTATRIYPALRKAAGVMFGRYRKEWLLLLCLSPHLLV